MRWPYIAAGLVAAPALLVLGAGGARGGDWLLLEMPRHITLLAIALGIAACFMRGKHKALLVIAGTAALALGWELFAEYRALSKLGRLELFGKELDLMVKLSVGRLAPWLMGVLYAALALLAITRVRDARRNRIRAGVWLVVAATVALLFTNSYAGWLTLENLGNPGTFYSAVAWPDTKKISLVLDLVALAVGLAAIFIHPRKPDPIPRATLR